MALRAAGGRGAALESALSPPRRKTASGPKWGEVWYVYTPGQPDDPHQPRPAIVVSENIRNRMQDDLIVVPVFTAGRPGPTRVTLSRGSSGLRHDSLAFCEEVTTIDRDFLQRGPIGVLSAELMSAVIRGVRRAMGEVLPRI